MMSWLPLFLEIFFELHSLVFSSCESGTGCCMEPVFEREAGQISYIRPPPPPRSFRNSSKVVFKAYLFDIKAIHMKFKNKTRRFYAKLIFSYFAKFLFAKFCYTSLCFNTSKVCTPMQIPKLPFGKELDFCRCNRNVSLNTDMT